jgi:YD repeat-containing protein
MTVNRYDWADRIVSSTAPDLEVTTTAYDLDLAATTTDGVTTNYGLERATVTDPLSRPVATTLSTRGQPIKVVKQNNTNPVIEARIFDAADRLVGVTDPLLAEWAYTYDMGGNRLTADDPDLGSWSYVYDKANRLIEQTDARGYVTDVAYDQLGRVTLREVTAPNLTVTTLADNTYDEAETGYFNVGQLTTSVNGAVTRERDYDASGGIARDDALIEGARHVTATLRNAGHLTEALTYEPHTLAVGTALDPWSYNAAGMLYAMPGLVASIDYEADGQTKEVAYANGVVTRFTYSPERRWLTRIETIAPDGVTALMDYTYTRDEVGRITRIDGLTAAESWIYTYDDLDQLLTADNLGDDNRDETFTYNDGGNMLSRTSVGSYAYPGTGLARPHAPLTAGSLTFAYDDNGNLTTDGSRTLSWDGANRLESVISASQATVVFGYDADG